MTGMFTEQPVEAPSDAELRPQAYSVQYVEDAEVA